MSQMCIHVCCGSFILITYFVNYVHKYIIKCDVTLQDIVKDAEIKLDFFFKASLIHDLVNVSVIPADSCAV